MRGLDFEEFISQNKTIIFKICRFYYQDWDDIQDLFQEIVIQLWKGFHSFESKSKLSTWIYRVSLNTAINYSKKENNRPIFIQLSNELQDIQNSEQTDIFNDLYRLIDQLNPVERSLIFLYIDGKSYQEMAEIMNETSTNIGTKIQRIKLKLIQFNNLK